MKRHIELKRLGDVFIISEQTHRENEFNNGEYFFVASDGFRICSLIYPAVNLDWYESDKIKFFVRGSDTRFDNQLLEIPSEEWYEQCQIAVKEYNEDESPNKGERKMIKFTTAESREAKESIHEVTLEITVDSIGSAHIGVKGIHDGHLVTLYKDGTIFLHSGINRNLGFQLDGSGRIKIDNEYPRKEVDSEAY